MADHSTFRFRKDEAYASVGLEDYTFTLKACIPPDPETRDWVIQVDMVAETHPYNDVPMMQPGQLPDDTQMKAAARAAAELVAAKPSVLVEWTTIEASGYVWELHHHSTRINTSSMPGQGVHFLGLKLTCLRHV